MLTKMKSIKFCCNFLIFFGCVMHKSAFGQISFLINNNFGYELFNNYANFFNETSQKVPQTLCEKHLEILKEDLQQSKLWALKFVDAWAKIPAGIIYGHTTEMGNFDECLSLDEKVFDDVSIKGKYCLTNVQLDGSSFPNLQDTNNVVNLDLGICIPAACSASEIELLLGKYFKDYFGYNWKNSSISIIEKQCTQKEREPFNTLDWIAVAILILLGSFMLLSTLYDYYSTKRSRIANPLLAAFSVRSNMRQLMRMTSPADTPKHIIPSLHGIRCLSMIWITITHSYLMFTLSPNINSADILSWSESAIYLIFLSGKWAVDSFFFLSGMMLVSVAFREMEKKSGKLNIPLMYLHRYIRLSPMLYLAVLLFMTLFRFSGNGPIWNSFTSSYRLCEETWWATLLYVQNYVAPGGVCLGHSWYLAVDTQLYILSPIALILIWKWRRWGVAVLLFIGLLLVAVLFFIIIFYDLVVYRQNEYPGADTPKQRLTYLATHARTSPWIIGIVFGYFMHTHSGRRVILPKFAVICGWVLSLALFFTVIFALYPKTQPGASLITPLEGAFYLSLSRVAWPLGLCWLVFACVNGYAGPINSFLSCKIWQPFSKLSYSMYIWHFLVIMVNAGQIKTNSHFSTFDVMLRFWGDFGFTILLSTVMHLAIEAPMLGIEKFLLAQKPKKVDTDKQPPNTISKQNLCD